MSANPLAPNPFINPLQSGSPLQNQQGNNGGASISDLNQWIQQAGAPQTGNNSSNIAYGPFSSQYMANNPYAAVDHSQGYQEYLNSLGQGNSPAASNGGGLVGAGYPSPVGNSGVTLSPLQQLQAAMQQQLSGIGGISNYEMPYSQIQSMAQNQTNAQYDPQINNLLGQIAQQKQLTSVNQGKASDMYNALGNSYTQDIGQVQAQNNQEKQAATDQYKGSEQQLASQYQNQSTAQTAALDKLGIQAAQGGGSAGNANVPSQNAPGIQGVGQQQSTDQKYLQGQMALQQQQANNNLTQQGDSAVQYQNTMADSSKMQGANDVTNLQNSLQNYLTGAQTQQQSLVGAKASALAGMEGQLQWQNIQNAQTQYQNAFNRVMAQNNFGLDVQKESDVNTNAANSLANQLAQAQLHYGSGTVNMPGTTGQSGGPTGMANELVNLYGGANQSAAGNQTAVNIENAVNQAMANISAANNSAQQHGQRLQTDETYYESQLKGLFGQYGITSPADMNNAIMALRAYQGQIK
jgi:hypothetical protein